MEKKGILIPLNSKLECIVYCMYINPIFFLSFFQHKYDFIVFVCVPNQRGIFIEKKTTQERNLRSQQKVGVLRLPDLGSEGPCQVLLALWTAI